MHGHISYTFPDKYHYEKEYIKGIKSGKSVRIVKNGDRYEGLFEDGKEVGEFNITFKTNGLYKGGMLNNKMHGYGERRFPSGTISTGEYVYGKMTGKATDGSRYEGEFKNH
jgi:hypothetical protein